MKQDDSGNAAKRWVTAWLGAGPAIEAIRRRELEAFRYEDHMEEIDELLEIACRFARPRTTSGMVEQQSLFQRARRLLDGPTG